MQYVDVHTHLTHARFDEDRDQVIARAINAGLSHIVVNGLEPRSNRMILEMQKVYPQIKAALGIYPVDAVAKLLAPDFPHPTPVFDVDAEIAFIDDKAKHKEIVAVGECGLDGHWLKEATFPEQERVFIKLIEVALRYDLPLIIHTRKLEERSMEILAHYGVSRVNFHCFGGRTKLAQKGAETHGWWFSIPANAARSEAFTKMLKNLPLEKILTETDAPYLPPIPGMRNEPCHIPGTVKLFAALRNLAVADAAAVIMQNYRTLFKEA